jgi:hypothetical protein
MTELRRESFGKRSDRSPRAVHALQDERRARNEFREDFIVGDLVADLSAGTTTARETGRRQQIAVPAHPDKGRSQPSPRD